MKGKFFGLIFIVILLAAGVYVGTQQFSVTSINADDIIWLPEYSSIWCGLCSGGTQIGEQNKIIVDGVSYGKDICDDSAYIPKGCNIDFETEGGWGESAIMICNPGVSESSIKKELTDEITYTKSGNNIPNCKFYDDDYLEPDNQFNFQIAQGDVFYVMSEQTYTTKKSYDPFCLRTLERGFLSSKAGCSSKLLLAESFDAPTNLPDVLNPNIYGEQNAVENVIIGYSGYINNVNVVEDGAYLKFLQKPASKIESCEINEDKSGKFYVDIRSCKPDSNFICIPSLTPEGYICNGGKELIEVKDNAECSSKSFIGGYKIVDDEKCEVLCEDGKFKVNKCEEVIGLNDGKIEPIENPVEPEKPLTWLWIVLIFTVIMIIMVLVALKMKGVL